MTIHPVATRIPYLSRSGSTIPLYASIRESLVYDEPNKRTIFAFEAWTGSDRRMYVGWRDHDAGTTHGPYDVGLTGYISNDDHGVPTLCKDHQNYWHVFGGSHSSGTWLRHARTTNPNDLTAWTVVTGFETTAVAYPKPVAVDDRIYILHRGSGGNSSKLRLVSTSPLSNGALTSGYSAISDVIDFEDGTEPRFYAGNIIKVGTELRGIAYWGDNPSTVRKDLYFFRYDTADGSLKNFSGSTSVASGSLPVNKASMDSNFRIFEHTGGNEATDIPVWYYDREGRATVWFTDGDKSADPDDEGPFRSKVLRETAAGSGTFGSPIDTGIDHIGRFSTFGPSERRDGSVDFYYIDPDDRWPEDWLTGSPFTPSPGGGHVNLVRFASDLETAVKGPERIVTAIDYPIERFVVANPAHPTLRAIFAECADNNSDAAAGNKRIFGHGSRGFVHMAANG